MKAQPDFHTSVCSSVLATWLVTGAVFIVSASFLLFFFHGKSNALEWSVQGYSASLRDAMYLFCILTLLPVFPLLLFGRYVGRRNDLLTVDWLKWEYGIVVGLAVMVTLLQLPFAANPWLAAGKALPYLLTGALAFGAGQWAACRLLTPTTT